MDLLVVVDRLLVLYQIAQQPVECLGCKWDVLGSRWRGLMCLKRLGMAKYD